MNATNAVRYETIKSNLKQGVYGNVPADLVDFITSGKKPVATESNRSVLGYVKNLIGTSDALCQWVRAKYNIMFFSPGPGSGKTLSALRIGLSYTFYTDEPFYFINMPEFLELNKRAMNSQEELNKLNHDIEMISTCKVVIFDDICRKECTPYEEDVIYRTLNSCSGAKIFTSNIDPDHLRKFLSGGVADRILSGQNLRFPDASWRKERVWIDESKEENSTDIDTGIHSFSDWYHYNKSLLWQDRKNMSKGSKARMRAGITHGWLDIMNSCLIEGVKSVYYESSYDPHSADYYKTTGRYVDLGINSLLFDCHSFSQVMNSVAQDIAPGHYDSFGWKDTDPLFPANELCYQTYIAHKDEILASLPEEWR